MWHVHTGRLLATFRGHSKEICDIDVNFENTLVASASLDKKVRVWNLKTTKMECVLHGHQSGVNATRVRWMDFLLRGKELFVLFSFLHFAN